MDIRVNGKTVKSSPGITLDALVSELKSSSEGIAVAINLQVVPRAQWNSRVLEAGDAIEIVRAVGGG